MEVSTDGGKRWKDAEIQGTAHRMAHTRFSYQWNWDGKETELLSRCTDETRPGSTVASPGRQVLERAPGSVIQRAWAGQHHSAVEDRQRWERAQWECLGFSRLCCSWGSPRWRSRPRYGVGRTPSAEEIRAWDISVGPTGAELPPGRGTAKEGAQALCAEGVRGMPREDGDGGHGSRLEQAKLSQMLDTWDTGANTADPLAVRDDGVGLHQSRHASQ